MRNYKQSNVQIKWTQDDMKKLNVLVTEQNTDDINWLLISKAMRRTIGDCIVRYNIFKIQALEIAKPVEYQRVITHECSDDIIQYNFVDQMCLD
ncbi:Homeobox-like_domain superfamily [Hexamita inflata]|uniref:Homeobox-like domain superfamily n=1 Tax=Hexamita inflata TaxID=28002 RepID=A0AA86PAG9_9EUKA|nr:Homeobox-like domain superfamily [Hexamita inflata]